MMERVKVWEIIFHVKEIGFFKKPNSGSLSLHHDLGQIGKSVFKQNWIRGSSVSTLAHFSFISINGSIDQSINHVPLQLLINN